MTTDKDKAALREEQLRRRNNSDWLRLMLGYEDIRSYYCRSREDQDAMGTAMDEVERVAHAIAIKNNLPGVERNEEGTQGYEFVVEKYKCHNCREGSNWHTRDEVILRANGDMLDALVVAPVADMDEDSPLHELHGAILHALDELQLLGVEGFKHPEDPTEAEDHGKSSIRRDDKALIRQAEEMDDVSDEQRVWRAAQEGRGSIQLDPEV